MTDRDRQDLLLALDSIGPGSSDYGTGNRTLLDANGTAASAALVNATAGGGIRHRGFNGTGWRNLSDGGPVTAGSETAVTVYHYWMLVMLLVPVATIFGNILVVLAVTRERSLQSVTNYFIVSLAFADILVAAIVMPVSVFVEVRDGYWMFSDQLCDLWIMCDALFSTASILNLVAISIDRFIAVTQPIKYAKHKNSKRTHVTIALTWLLSIAIALPIGCGLQNLQGLRYDEKFRHVCTFFNGDFLIYSSLGSFYIPCIVMLVLYHRIFTVIRRRARKADRAKNNVRLKQRGNHHHQQQQQQQQEPEGQDRDLIPTVSNHCQDRQTQAGPSNSDNSGNSDGGGGGGGGGVGRKKQQLLQQLKLRKRPSSGQKSDGGARSSAARREKKATKTLAIVLGVFLLCWLPFFITNLMWAACLKNFHDQEWLGAICQYDRRINVFIVWLGYVNSFMNPVIYTIFNTEFRKAFKKLLHMD